LIERFQPSGNAILSPAVELLERNESACWRLIYLTMLICCAWAAAAPGKDVNWDQLNYHVYVAHAFIHDRLFLDIFAANIQSYINPIPFLPFYAVVASGMSSAIGAALLGVLQGASLIAVAEICKLLTRGEPIELRIGVVLLVVAVAGLHPLFIAGLGTSLSEMVATVPALWGVYFLLRHDAQRVSTTPRKAGLVDAGAGAALLTTAFLWKLPMAFLAAGIVVGFALPAFFFSRSKLRLIGSYLLGTAIGLIAGGVVHYWRVFVETGNPFFPFFNPWFQSALYAPHAVVNHRFKTWDWSSIVLAPVRMLEDAPFVSAEITVIDPRYLCFALVLALLVWRIVKPRLMQSNASRLESQVGNQRTMGRVDLQIVAFVMVGYLAWILTIGNGRYALPLHLLVPVGIFILLRQITDQLSSAVAALALVAFVQLLATLIVSPLPRWDREAHIGPWSQVSLPAAYNQPGGMYVSLAYGDRRSWSGLVPQLDPTARFLNLDGYENTRPDRYIGKVLNRQIQAHDRPMFAVLERRELGFADPANAEWRNALSRQLRAYGLALIDPASCQPVVERFEKVGAPGTAATRMLADVCPVKRVDAVDFRADFAREERAMSELEERYPALLYPPNPAGYLFGAMYCKFYTPQEVYVCARDGKVFGKRIAPLQQILFTITLP